MNFEDSDFIYLTEKKERITPGIGTINFIPDFQNPYKYASKATLQYLQKTLNLDTIDLIKNLIKLNKNTNPLKATTIPNLLHCGLIYKLDLINFLTNTVTPEHFTNLRLIIYLISLMPQFGKPKNDITHVIHKIAPNYLKYLLREYNITGLDPAILTDDEVYEAFEKLQIPPKYKIYDERYLRFHQLFYLRDDVLKILTEKLYGCTDLISVVTKTKQSNLERILISAVDYEDLIQKLGMHPLKMQEYNFDADEYILNNFMDYISYTDPAASLKITDLYTAIEKGVIEEFISRYSDYDLIYNITGIFVSYKSRKELIFKLKALCEKEQRFFVKVSEKPTLCYGNLQSYTEYSPEKLKLTLSHPLGFMSLDTSLQFSIVDIKELCETGIYFKQFHGLINFCKEKINNLKNKK